MRGKINYILVLIFFLGTMLRLADIWRPINRASWRECDLGAIARNYVCEGMNPFYPRVDWRGETEGFAEMEFPIYPYLTAVLYEIFGTNEILPRVLSFIFSLVGLWFFLKLARLILDESAAIFAFAFFAFHPLTIELSSAIQSEIFMFAAYVAGVYFFVNWLKINADKDLIFAGVATASAILLKATAAHVGLLFGILIWQKFGLSAIRQSRLYLFGVLSLAPPIAWYLHAKNLWKTYGNSLGVSNETHLVGADFFTDSYFIRGILTQEFFVVWLGFGLFVGVFAVWQGWREKTVRSALVWLAAIFAFYVLAARTTADDWAYYYHIFSVAPAAVLFGFGVEKTAEKLRGIFDFGEGSKHLSQKILGFVLVISIFGTFSVAAKKIRENFLLIYKPDESFSCASQLKPLLKKDGLILVSGATCVDNQGFPVAYNASFMFYWLERKGFNICTQEQSVAKVREFSVQGAKYFVAQKNLLSEKPNFEAELRQNFKVAGECDSMILFDLEQKP